MKVENLDLSGFTTSAQEKLRESVNEYALDLIDEAKRVERDLGGVADGPEITRAVVNNAQLLLSRGLGAPKPDTAAKFTRVAAAVLSLLVGALYDKDQMQNDGYMLAFVLVTAAAILAVTISTLRS